MDTLPEVRAAALTDAGTLRSVNEDSVLAEFPVFLVADGMGGHEAGDEASRAAIEAFARAIPAGAPSTIGEVGAALEAARDAVARVAADRRRGAGCTLTGAVLVEHEGRANWLVLNIGDSRVYLHRGAELHQITVDHSLRDEMIAGGAQDPATLPGRNVITRALGSADTTADSWLLPVEDGARLLVCSDGLTTEVDDQQLRAVLTMGGPAESVAEELVRRANAAGGRDNITVVVVDVVAGGDAWHVVPTGSDAATEDDLTVSATVPRRAR